MLLLPSLDCLQISHMILPNFYPMLCMNGSLWKRLSRAVAKHKRPSMCSSKRRCLLTSSKRQCVIRRTRADVLGQRVRQVALVLGLERAHGGGVRSGQRRAGHQRRDGGFLRGEIEIETGVLRSR